MFALMTGLRNGNRELYPDGSSCSDIGRNSPTDAVKSHFRPLEFHLEPPDVFIRLCFLRLLLPWLAFTVRSDDAGSIFRQLPFAAS